MEPKSNKTIVRECYRKIIRDLDLSLVDVFIKDDYIQHSPTVKNGKAGVLEMLHFLKTLPKPAEQGPSPVIRVIAEGDLVAVHLDVKFMGRRVAVIDLFRVEDGLLAEHWDAGQPQSGEPDALVTMTNGTVEINEAANADLSKQVVAGFYREVFENKDPEAAKLRLSKDFMEHNPINGLMNKLDDQVTVHKMIAESDFVVTQCEYVTDSTAFARYSIFRIADCKIAEHWSVEQQVPAVTASGNGMF
jgi:predicted SnoaL-like aldol condensation-catalyzing enzyme